jgi:hypothetical protein
LEYIYTHREEARVVGARGAAFIRQDRTCCSSVVRGNSFVGFVFTRWICSRSNKQTHTLTHTHTGTWQKSIQVLSDVLYKALSDNASPEIGRRRSRH